MITFEEAKRIALEQIGPDCMLVESAIIEKPYGWCFVGQSRAFVKTGDMGDMFIGTGGFLVERANGRVFRFGSAYPIEQWIANYERGFRYERYDLEILAVADLARAVEFLARLDLHYVVPELECGTVWRIPRSYAPERIREMLGQLPCTFVDQAFWHRVEVFDEIDASGCLVYELRGHAAQPSLPLEEAR